MKKIFSGLGKKKDDAQASPKMSRISQSSGGAAPPAINTPKGSDAPVEVDPKKPTTDPAPKQVSEVKSEAPSTRLSGFHKVPAHVAASAANPPNTSPTSSSTTASGRFSLPPSSVAPTATTATTSATSSSGGTAQPSASPPPSRFEKLAAAAAARSSAGASSGASTASGRFTGGTSTGVSGRHNLPPPAGAGGATSPGTLRKSSLATTTTAATAAPAEAPSQLETSPALERKDLPKENAAPKPKKKTERQKRRDSFYSTDRFRSLEAVDRDETDELRNLKVSREMEEHFRVLPRDVCRAFSDLTDVAREANTEILMPEFVVIGLAGHGKSSVIEGILGWPLLHVDFQTASKRPIHISVQNSPKLTEPRFTLMPDVTLGIKKRMAFTDAREVRRELQTRLSKNKDLIRNPIHLLVEYADAVNFDIIECPGLSPFNPHDAAASLVAELARPVHRILVVVEECIEWFNVNAVVLQTVLQLDPNFSRTVFVHNKLNTMLQGLYNPADVTNYFSGIVRVHAQKSSFWVTSLSSKARAACVSTQDFQTRLIQLRLRDVAELSYLQFDRKYEDFVGIPMLRAHLLKFSLARVRACVPQIFFSLKSNEEQIDRAIKKLEAKVEQGNSLDPQKAQQYGMHFVNDFLGFVEESIHGSLSLDPAEFGETALEEGSEAGFDEGDKQSRVKLIGAQQIQRLLWEMRHALSALDFDQIVPVTEFSDPNGPATDDWNRQASFFAHTALVRGVSPIFFQLCERAEHIVMRSFAVYDARYNVCVAEEHESMRFVLANSPYFRNLIRDRLRTFLLDQRTLLEKDLREELLSPETLLWSLQNSPGQYAPPKEGRAVTFLPVGHQDNMPLSSRVEQQQPADRFKGLSAEAKAELERIQLERQAQSKKPRALAKRIFQVSRNRIATNASLKLYKYMLDPFFGVLAEDLRNCVSKLNNSDIRQLFNVESALDTLTRRRSEMERLMDFLKDAKATYESSAKIFLSLVSPV